MFRNFADGVLGFFEGVLTFLHDIFVPIFGVHSWGWAIIALTVLVRVVLLPLAVKQIRSMRAMQAIQPEMREIQKKYKVDRSLMKKDPEQFRAKRQKLNEEMMALYRREGANPAASCLPLIAQAPIFIALFWTLREFETLANQPFYFFTGFIADDASAQGLGAFVSEAGWPGWMLIVLMSGSMFLMQKQMIAKNSAAQGSDNPMAQQQKILLYVLPVFLAVISFQFPLGILFYWVTTNLWQVGQQAIMLREVSGSASADGPDAGPKGSKDSKGSKGSKGSKDSPTTGGPKGSGAGSGAKGTGSASSGQGGKGGKRSRGGSSGEPAKGETPAEASKSSEKNEKPSDGAATSSNGEGTRGSRKSKGSKEGTKGSTPSAPGSRPGDGEGGGEADGSAETPSEPSANGHRRAGGDQSSGEAPAPRNKRDHLPKRGGKRGQ